LFVDASGNIGFKTSSPRALVDFGAGTGFGVLNQTVANYQAVFESPQGTGNVARNIAFAVGTNGIGAAINAVDNGASDATGLIIATGTAGSISERLRITSDGKLGLGTSSPDTNLEIALSGSSANGLLLSSDNADTSARLFFQNATAGEGYAILQDSGGLDFRSGATAGTSSGTQRVRIDSSGRLLVGTSSGRTVNGIDATIFNEGTSGGASSIALVRNSDNTGSPFVLFAKSRGTSNGSNTIVQTDDILGGVAFAGADGTDIQTLGALIEAKVDGTPGANDMPGRLVFATTADGASSPTERMRIGSDGFVRIGSPSPAVDAFLNVECNTSTAAIESSVDGGGVTLRTHISFSNSNGTVGSITTTGSATAYNTSSDYRLKENVVPLTGAADRLNQLQVHRFNFIADPDKTVDGFIAHEAQAVVPECVTGTKDEVDADGNPVYQGIDQSKLVPLLTAALQEAMERIETLEAEVQQLKGQ